MFTDFINRILGTERRPSVSNRLEDAVPSVIVKKDSNKTIPEKDEKDITALERYYDCDLSSLTGLSINLTLQ